MASHLEERKLWIQNCLNSIKKKKKKKNWPCVPSSVCMCGYWIPKSRSNSDLWWKMDPLTILNDQLNDFWHNIQTFSKTKIAWTEDYGNTDMSHVHCILFPTDNFFFSPSPLSIWTLSFPKNFSSKRELGTAVKDLLASQFFFFFFFFFFLFKKKFFFF